MENDVIPQVFLELTMENGYIPGYQSITRPYANGGTCIDNVLFKSESLEVKTYTIQSNITDHYTLLFKVNKLKQKVEKKDLNFIDYNKLKEAARLTNWDEIENLTDVNKATDLFIEKILNCIETSKTRKKNKFRKRKEWITKEIIESCEKNDKLYKIWKTGLANMEKKKTFTDYANKLNATINQAKNKFEKNKVQSISNNNRKL